MSETSSRRPPAPKPEDYVVVAGSRGSRRDFRISVGLREGWDAEGRVFDVSEAVRTARAWMESGPARLVGRVHSRGSHTPGRARTAWSLFLPWPSCPGPAKATHYQLLTRWQSRWQSGMDHACHSGVSPPPGKGEL